VNKISRIIWTAFIACTVSGLSAQGALSLKAGQEIPLNAVTLYSSGVGYFSHSGTVTGNAEAVLEFDADSLDDVLKSLTVRDPGTLGVSVAYDAEDTLERTLKSLSVDLSGSPSLGELLASLRGVSVSLTVPEKVTGRILGSEAVHSPEGTEWRLSVLTPGGIRRLSLDEITSLSFDDPAVRDDLYRALDLLAKGNASSLRKVRVSLPGTGTRTVSIGYVIPVPVWKTSYRLDLGGDTPFLQGWAIVDNSGSSDWKGIRLSLMNGRPVSFRQNLYNPFYIERPLLPLAIAGFAEAKAYDGGYGMAAEEYSYGEEPYAEMALAAPSPSSMPMAKRSALRDEALGAAVASAGSTATGRSAGELFEFTLKGSVTLDRRQSTMLPLTENPVSAERLSVFSGSEVASGGSAHPMLALRLKNTTGMKLPAGPVTVYDAGAYAGDALLDFMGEKEERLLAYGEDTAVTGWSEGSSGREVTGVTLSKGVMTIMRKTVHTAVYTLKNASATSRTVLLEHPLTKGSVLAQTQVPEERTDSLYRFRFSLGSGEERSFTVREETPVSETVELDRLKGDALAYYSTNQEIPEGVRKALARAVELRRRTDEAQRDLSELQERRSALAGEQERIRANLQAAGNASQQGKEYLKKLSDSDAAIEETDQRIEKARNALKEASSAYGAYLSSLSF